MSLHLVLVALTLAILVSAVLRMVLYQREYGLTELRFYTSVFMGWLALVLGWLYVRTRSIYGPIALHATFNGLQVLALSATQSG